MDLIKRCEPELKKLSKCQSIKDRRKCLRQAKTCVVNAISEISKNFLVGNLKLNKKKIEKLRKHRKAIELISKRRPVEIRRKEIIQRGGYLNLLIPGALFLLKKFLIDG